MFEKLSLLWKGDAPLKKEFGQFVGMLTMARELYHLIVEALRSGKKSEELETTVYQTDIKIDKLEREIRKALVTHLSFNPGQQIAGSLILMSVVKDAERLGDFCKNLY
ncbi:MAG: PhoU domain-containing protein, partial [Proteobacteria bacterium]|nr:PhoU domain-containing protein [Pseudomonadota bacterium]